MKCQFLERDTLCFHMCDLCDLVCELMPIRELVSVMSYFRILKQVLCFIVAPIQPYHLRQTCLTHL